MNGVDFDVSKPRVVDVDDRFFPALVQTRLAEARTHPRKEKQRG